MLDRVGINAGNGMRNTIDDIEYYKLVRDTCAMIYTLLAEHCGPYATDALIITDNPNSLKDKHYAIFTKDGINIVRSIEFVSPIQKHIQSLIAYIGERVDSLSHDGTTTSMMLFTMMVGSYFEALITDIELGNKPNRRQLRDDFIYQLNELTGRLEQQVVTVDKLAEYLKISKLEATRFVAYHQAMLSSKGDVELAKAITEAVEILPPELYGLFQISQSGMETNQRFTVVRDDFDYMVPVLANIDFMNHNMNTEFLSEDCDLIVCEDDLVRGNLALEVLVSHIAKYRSEAFPIVLDDGNIDISIGDIAFNTPEGFKYRQQTQHKDVPERSLHVGMCISLQDQVNALENGTWVWNGHKKPLTRPEAKRDLVILAKSLDGNLMGLFQQINQKIKNKITVFTVSTATTYASKCTALSAMLNIAGKYPMQEYMADQTRSFLIEGVKIHCKNRRVLVSNLYKKDGSLYHPYYNNPGTFEPYDKMVRDVREYLDAHNSGDLRFESAADRERYTDYNNIYRRLVCSEVRHLQISGMTHDVLHDRDILQDSFGSVMSSLEKGFIFDAYLKMNLIQMDIQRNTDVGVYGSGTFSHAVINVMVSAHRADVRKAVAKHVDAKDYTYLFFPIGEKILKFQKARLSKKEGDIVPAFYERGSSTSSHLVMQPADTYRELFRRLSDLVPKLINTSRAIVPGTVNEKSGDT